MSADFYETFFGDQRQPAPSPAQSTPRSSTEGLHPYAAGGIKLELEKLDALPRAWHDGARWDATTYEVACNLIELANSGWSGYSLSDAENDLYAHAPANSEWGRRKHEQKWQSARNKVGNQSRAEPAPNATYQSSVYEVPESEFEKDAAGGDQADDKPARRPVITPLSTVAMRATLWVWDGRIALGTLALLAGREGLGKSTLAYTLAADLTNGTLPGDLDSKPRGVIVCATEDSMSQTIVPRLTAAGADLNRVIHVDIETDTGIETLQLPTDIGTVERVAREHDVALMILDPLISRLGDLDTHRDAEVRQALEPLVRAAERARFSIVGLIHHNKSSATDPLALVMGSRAFTAVARSVHTVIPDPEGEGQMLFGTPKNNLGRVDLPSLVCKIDGADVGHDQELDKPITTGKLEWLGEREQSIGDILADTGEDDAFNRNEVDTWLRDYLERVGSASRKDIMKAAYADGWSKDQLDRARRRVGVVSRRVSGYQAGAVWELDTQ